MKRKRENEEIIWTCNKRISRSIFRILENAEVNGQTEEEQKEWNRLFESFHYLRSYMAHFQYHDINNNTAKEEEYRESIIANQLKT